MQLNLQGDNPVVAREPFDLDNQAALDLALTRSKSPLQIQKTSSRNLSIALGRNLGSHRGYYCCCQIEICKQ